MPKCPLWPTPVGTQVSTRGCCAQNSGVNDLIPLRTAAYTWFLISLQTFGGPAGQIAAMQRILVDEKRWIGQRRFLHALNYCMLLPGPEAQQLATYTGWLLNGVRGGIIAGTLFVLPGLLVMIGLSALYVAFGDTSLVHGLFFGLAPAVVAIISQALIRLSRPSLSKPSLILLAGQHSERSSLSSPCRSRRSCWELGCSAGYSGELSRHGWRTRHRLRPMMPNRR